MPDKALKKRGTAYQPVKDTGAIADATPPDGVRHRAAKRPTAAAPAAPTPRLVSADRRARALRTALPAAERSGEAQAVEESSNFPQPPLAREGSAETPSGTAAAVAVLVEYLATLQPRLQALLALAEEKLAALRKADTAALRCCAAREEPLVREVLTQEARRPAILAAVAQALRRPELRNAGLAALAARLPQALAAPLLARHLGLQTVAAQLQRKNRIAAAVARNLQGHIREVFAAVAKCTQEPAGYSAGGNQARSAALVLLDAVG